MMRRPIRPLPLTALLLVCLLCLANFVDAQPTFVWAKTMGGTSTDRGYSIALDASGNIYTTGYFQSTADFDPGPGTLNFTAAGSNEIFVCKLDPSGNLIWARQMGGTSIDRSYAIAVDGLGNVYTTGYFEGISDFDPGPGTYNLTAPGSDPDIFVSKLDAGGNFVWARQMGGSGDDRGYAIALDAAGNVYTTGYFGYFGPTADFDPGPGTFNLTAVGNKDIFISKLDASGNFIWARQMGGTNSDQANSIAIDGGGNVYTAGNFYFTANFDPGPGTYNLSSGGSYDIFVSKLDPSGNFVWAKRMGGTGLTGGADFGYSMDLDGSGNAYVTGSFTATCDFDPSAGTYNLTSAGNRDIYVAKLDPAGNFVWAISAGNSSNDYGMSIAIDPSENVYVMGDQYSGTVDYDPGPGTYTETNTGTESNFISSYDSDGNFRCALSLSPGHNEVEANRHLAVDGSGNVFATAIMGSGAIDFDPCPPVYNASVYGGYDIYVAKYNFNNCNCGPLPVDVLSFSGLNEGRENVLEWRTLRETNNDYFAIESSPDGARFEAIGKVDGAGTVEQAQSYRFIDEEPGPITYYRLKQTDFNGSYTYSEIISVRKAEESAISDIHPNPAGSHFSFTYTGDAETLSVTLTNVMGQEVLRKDFSGLSGNARDLTVQLDGLPRGAYYASFQYGKENFAQKLILSGKNQ